MKCTICERYTPGRGGVYTPHPSTKGQEKIGAADLVWVCAKCHNRALETVRDNVIESGGTLDDALAIVLHAMLALKLGYAV